ncbi:MAG: beta-N-acetylhexosaminidase [Oscillospiraceae bacterium]|nr:beta-N-acetylhexosaminidase [Oscillospiraceae bacterium]
MRKSIAVIIASAMLLASCGGTENIQNSKSPISALTTEQKIGQLFCVSFSGTELDKEVCDFFEEYSIGNVILFSKNIENAEQTGELCRDIQSKITRNTGIPAFIGTDQEGGQVVRVTDGAVYYPGAMTIAATNNTENAESVGRYMGEELHALGINIDFAPDADINSNPDNPVIGARSFGDNAENVAQYAAAFVNGMNSAGEVSVAKHYPGHGDVDTDSHYGLPTVDKPLDELLENELLPFKTLIESGAPAIMAAHILYPRLDENNPASMSRVMLTDILRERMGFNGMIVTDGIRMGAIADNFGIENACVAAINAGADLIITGSGGKEEDLSLGPQIKCVEKVREAVESGEISGETLDKAVERVLKCKSDYEIEKSEFAGLDENTLESHRELADAISRNSITLVRDENNLLPIRGGESVLIISSDSVRQLDENDKKISISEYLAEKLGGDSEIIPPLGEMTENELDNLLNFYREKAAQYDKVIVCTNRASHSRIVNSVIEGNPNTVAVSFDTPYILRSLEGCTAFLCTYENTSDAAKSTADILSGEAEAVGILPVSW